MLLDQEDGVQEVRRIWHTRRTVTVETLHPTCGWLTRGMLKARDVADTTAPGLAGHIVWTGSDYDHNELAPVTGDYVTAEKALLDATTALED